MHFLLLEDVYHLHLFLDGKEEVVQLPFITLGSVLQVLGSLGSLLHGFHLEVV